jgi:hypothetical protein
MISTKLLEPNLLYGIDEAWYQSTEGRKRIAEMFAHNEGILARLFGSDAFLEHSPEEEDGPIEIASCTLEPDILLTDSEPLNPNPITKEGS